MFWNWAFSIVIYYDAATNLFKMLLKYRPEDKDAKKERLLKRAQAEAEGKTVEAKKPIVVKYGLNHITYLIEQVCCICNFEQYFTPIVTWSWILSRNSKHAIALIKKNQYLFYFCNVVGEHYVGINTLWMQTFWNPYSTTSKISKEIKKKVNKSPEKLLAN